MFVKWYTSKANVQLTTLHLITYTSLNNKINSGIRAHETAQSSSSCWYWRFTLTGSTVPHDFSKQKSLRWSWWDLHCEGIIFIQYLKLKERLISCLTRHTVGGGSVLIGHCFLKNGNYWFYVEFWEACSSGTADFQK